LPHNFAFLQQTIDITALGDCLKAYQMLARIAVKTETSLAALYFILFSRTAAQIPPEKSSCE
jgi:hypothetical protein